MSVRVEAYLVDLGKTRYVDAHRYQLDCVNYRLLSPDHNDIFIITEHLPVFTLGRRGDRSSLMVSEQHAFKHGVDIVQTERGGDITYHGPGQLVIYPIINLKRSRLSIKGYVDLLEEVMISCAHDFGIDAVRDRRNRGIWVKDNKLGSIGIRVRHGVSFHGMALNIAPDFTHFNWIQPCGLQGVGVTSFARERGGTVDYREAKESAIDHLQSVFKRTLISAPMTVIAREGYGNG